MFSLFRGANKMKTTQTHKKLKKKLWNTFNAIIVRRLSKSRKKTHKQIFHILTISAIMLMTLDNDKIYVEQNRKLLLLSLALSISWAQISIEKFRNWKKKNLDLTLLHAHYKMHENIEYTWYLYILL